MGLVVSWLVVVNYGVFFSMTESFSEHDGEVTWCCALV